MRKIDSILWHILAVTGLNFLNYRLGLTTKFFRILFITVFTISLLYFLFVHLCLIKNKHYKEPIINSLLCIYSVLMWCIAYYKRKTISHVISRVYRLEKYYNTSTKTLDIVLISLAFITLMMPCVSCIVTLTRNFENYDVACFTFGHKMQNKIWKKVFVSTIRFVYFGLFDGFPYYLIICIGVLFYRCSEILSGYKIFLRIQFQKLSKVTDDNFTEFFRIVNILCKLNKAFTHLSFFIILFHFQGIITLFIRTSRPGSSEFGSMRIFELAYYAICDIILFVYFTICSSTIPERLVDIKRLLKSF